jgi:hypothetical protein
VSGWILYQEILSPLQLPDGTLALCGGLVMLLQKRKSAQTCTMLQAISQRAKWITASERHMTPISDIRKARLRPRGRRRASPRAEEVLYPVKSSILASGAFFLTDSMPFSMLVLEE